MTEIEMLQRAKEYMEKLANGINPLTNEQVAENDIVNNIRISRCFFYVSDVLKQVIVEKAKSTEIEKQPQSRSKFEYSDTPITSSEIAKRLNAILSSAYKRTTAAKITGWLIEEGMLRIKEYNGRTYKSPTQEGNELGISTEKRTGQRGEYVVLVFSKNAQQFIVNHFKEIVNFVSQNDSKPENDGQPWSEEHTNCLIELFQKNVPISEIAVTLQRTEGSISGRLVKLGLIERKNEIQ